MDPQLVTALKALTDASRLRIVGLLAGGRRLSVEELVDASGLARRTVEHHLQRLRDADLVTAHPRPPSVEHELRLDRLASIGGELDRIGRRAPEQGARPPGTGGESMPDNQAKVLRAFLVDGRLERIPAQDKKRQVILRFLARTDFRAGEGVSERDVNMRLALRHPDVAALRRYLVDNGYMERSGGVYRLLPEDRWPTLETSHDD